MELMGVRWMELTKGLCCAFSTNGKGNGPRGGADGARVELREGHERHPPDAHAVELFHDLGGGSLLPQLKRL